MGEWGGMAAEWREIHTVRLLDLHGHIHAPHTADGAERRNKHTCTETHLLAERDPSVCTVP